MWMKIGSKRALALVFLNLNYGIEVTRSIRLPLLRRSSRFTLLPSF